MISCEIANTGKYDLIIPFRWWHDEYLLKDIANPSKWVFHNGKCHAHIEDEAVAGLFKWDETVAYDKVAQYLGRIGREDAGGVQLETLPNANWQ